MYSLVRRHHPLARFAAFAVLFAALFSGAGVARTLHVAIAHGGGACGATVCGTQVATAAAGDACHRSAAAEACGLGAIDRLLHGHAHDAPREQGADHEHDRNHHHSPHDCAICLELALLTPALSLVAPFVAFSEPTAIVDDAVHALAPSPAAPEVCAARPPPACA
ncbi:MAG: hypothetical protein GC172_00290 [Phycisphaera sp.]|nr:hypothetical protein [Phycisphaera sp.]